MKKIPLIRSQRYRYMGTLCFLVCYLFQIAQAQEVTVTGSVSDASTGESLIGASVAIVEDGIGAYTNEAGKYKLIIPINDRQMVPLTISYAGYTQERISLPLTEGANITRDIKLQPEGFTTEDVVITASKSFEQKQSDVTVSIQVVKPAAIDLQAVATVENVLVQIPGVDNLDGQVSIRGSSGFAYGVGSRVLVMMNGLPLLTGDAGSADLRLIPVDNIQQIEVVKGASSVLYGSSALGGVINVITSEPDETPKTSIRLRQAIYDKPRNKALDWDGTSSAFMSSAHIFHSRRIGDVSMVLQTDLIKDSGYRQGTDREEIRGLAMLQYKPQSIPGLTIGLNASARRDSSGATLYWDSYYPDTTQVINGTDTTNFISGGALTPTDDGGAFRKQLVRRVALDPTIKYLTNNGNLFWYRGRFLNVNNSNNSGQGAISSIFYNDFLFQTDIANKINWTVGATYTYSRVDGSELYGGPSVINGDTVISDGIFTGNSLGLYTQFDAKLGKLNASLGLRMETVKIDTLERETQPIIRFGLNYELKRGTNVRASFGQAFRVPSVAERYTSTTGGGIIVEPNPTVKSETGFSAEVGFRQGFQFKGSRSKFQGYLDVAGFTMRYNDMVEFGLKPGLIYTSFPPSARFSTVNITDARITGVEFTSLVEGQWGDFFLNFSGGVTYIDPQNLNALPADKQLDLSGYPDDLLNLLNSLEDPTRGDQPPVLKYRTRWLARTSIGVGYSSISLTSNIRYRSFMENIDQFLYLVVQDLGDFRRRYPNGETVVDFILKYNITPKSSIALNVNNAFNVEYLNIPGFLAEQRKFTLQYAISF